MDVEEIIRLQEYEPLWNEWNIKELICEGNLSSVYEVTNGKKDAVIKVISIPKLQNEGTISNSISVENQEAMSGFFSEVVAVLETELDKISIINNIPNILGYQKYKAFRRVEDVGYDLILLMDKKQNLKDYFLEHEDLTNEQIVSIVKEIAILLGYAHQEGILHKDLKIENVFIDEEGHGMLADFSLARKIEGFQSRSNRKTDMAYNAPEIFSEYDYTEATDLYALGVLLYILLNDLEVPKEFSKRNFQTEIVKPVRAEKKLASLVLKAISYRETDRFNSVDQFIQAMDRLTQEDIALPSDYISEKEAREKKQEQVKQEQKEKQLEEERKKREEEERKQQERKQQEENRKAELEKQRQEEERLREIQRIEQEKRKEKETTEKAEEAFHKAEQKVQKCEQNSLEDNRKKEQQEQKEALRLIAEEDRRRYAEIREQEEMLVENIPQKNSSSIFEEETLSASVKELNTAIKRYEKVSEEAKEGCVDADGHPIYDREKEPVREFTDYSSDFNTEKLDEVFEDVLKMKKQKQNEEKQKEDTDKTNHEVINLHTEIEEEQDGETENAATVKIRAVENEYSGFFDFDSDTYQPKNEEKQIEYDKHMEEEPYEQKLVPFEETKKGKKSILVILVLLVLFGIGFFCWKNKNLQKIVTNTYNSLLTSYEKQMTEMESKEIKD